MTAARYLRGLETLRRRELVWGVVREPPAPFYGHQALVTRLAALLEPHVRAKQLGRVCVAPIDVVLDARRHLVVQPDLVFVSAARLSIIQNQIWGAPDLVVEVLSPGTARHDGTTKLAWYGQYGVGECWLVDPRDRRLEVVTLAGPRPGRRSFRAGRVRSRVLPGLRLRVAELFE